MGLYPQIDQASYESLTTWWRGPLPTWVDYRATVLEEIAYAFIKCGPPGIRLLQTHTQDADEDKRVAALAALSHKEVLGAALAADLCEAFYTPQSRLKTVALWGFIDLEIYPLPRAELEQLMRETDERLSALAMIYLSWAYPSEAISLLRNGLHSSNPRQREYACDVIGDRGLTELKSEIAALLNDSDEYVRQAAQINLEMLGDE